MQISVTDVLITDQKNRYAPISVAFHDSIMPCTLAYLRLRVNTSP